MIDLWIILISGFTEDLRSVTGTEKLWSKLRGQSAPQTCVQHRLWKDDWEGFASMIFRNSVEAPRIVVGAYSWGGGWGFTQLAANLGSCGLKIAHAVLADPVYRSPLHVMKWRSLINRGPLAPKIRIAENVEKVTWLRQKQNKPQGHELVWNATTTEVEGPAVLHMDHGYVDDAPAYHQEMINAAKREAA